jgi:hypothetical protein
MASLFDILIISAFKSPNVKMPFQALDLTYIYSLLHDGYNISDSTQIHVNLLYSILYVFWYIRSLKLFTGSDLLVKFSILRGNLLTSYIFLGKAIKGFKAITNEIFS